ncbi:actin 2 [Mycena sanguinolenta]|nr:actin 2 [Mycena sanguinolenta]
MAVPLVFDNGSAKSRAGFAGEDMPYCSFPSVTGHIRSGLLPPGFPMKDCYVGEEVLAARAIVRMKHPIIYGLFQKWSDMEAVWRHTFYHELHVSPEEHPVLLAEVPFNPKASREQMATIMFETFNIPAFYVQVGAVLALFASGRNTGIILDSGEGESRFVPVYEGFSLRHGIRHVDIGGRDVSERVMKDIKLMDRSNGITTTAERELVRDIKETLCYVVLDFEQDSKATGTEHSYELPDGQVIRVGNERFSAPEALFKPWLANSNSPGIHEITFKSITSCDADLQPRFFNNVFLSGGNTLFPGLPDRLRQELSRLAPPGVTVQIHAPRQRRYSTWMGGSILACLSTFKNLWCSRKEYDEYGAGIVHRKCF